MSKLPLTTRRTTNLLLQHIADKVSVGDVLPTETWMSAHVACSRTVVRGIDLFH